MASLWLTGTFLFLDRVNISLAAPFIMKEYGFSAAQRGVVLSTYYWGYLFGSLAGGLAADRLRIRVWTTTFYLIWCVTTFLTGLSRSYAQFISVRLVFGVAEGAVTNPMNKLINYWVLPQERGSVFGAQLCFCYLGLVIGMPLVGWLIAAFGWREMFYVTGLITLVGVLTFWVLVRDRPSEHPWISASERDRIEDALAKDRVTYDPETGKAGRITFNQALRIAVGTRSFWLLCIAYFFIGGTYFTNFGWLPGYLMMERGISGLDTGFLLILPYLSAAIGALGCGYVGDRLGNRSIVAIIGTGLAIPAIAGVVLTDQREVLIAMLCLMLFFNSAAVSTLVVLLYDLLPAEIIGLSCGVMVGIFGGLGGVAGPMMMGMVYDATQSFSWGFLVLGSGLAIAIAVLVGVFRGELAVKKAKGARLQAVPVS
jgi:sugar phosphate permease